MEPTPLFIIGALFGLFATLSVQYYGRRKVKHASKEEQLAQSRQTELLTIENGALKGQMSRLEERLSVMERITTDSHMELSNEIEQLR